MSKASKWAELEKLMKLSLSNHDEARVGLGGVVLTHYDTSGSIAGQLAYSASEALTLAHWLVAMLEEGR